MYTIQQFFDDLCDSIESFYIHDNDLVASKAERPSAFRIAHYLAEHIEKKTDNYRVDCEVHKGPEGTKKVFFPEDDAVYSCRPDLIVHQPHGHGLAMVEFKTQKNDKNDDRKLKFFTSPKDWYKDMPWLKSVKVNYDIGIFVYLSKQLPMFKIYYKGQRLKNNEAREVLMINNPKTVIL